MAASTITVGIAVIHREAVIKAGTLPGRGIMALRALPLEVVSRTVDKVTGLAIRGAHRLVVECAVPPGSRIMAL